MSAGPFNLEAHVRPELARPSPYRWQEGIPDGPVDRFDMNTPPDGPEWYPAALARLAAIPANDYPDASYLPLKRAIGAYLGEVPPEQIVVGAGCDEVLALCAGIALGRGDAALVARPTYQLYTVASRNAGAEMRALDPVEGIGLDWSGLLREAPNARALWICSPNNPTGEEAEPELVGALCRACPGIVVVDQAYLEYGGFDMLPLVAKHPNLVVTRTFSKGYGLGAARVGYGVAQPPLASALDALRPPGSISSWSAAVAELACTNADEMRGRCARLVAERARLADALRDGGVEVAAEAGNFVLAHAPVADTFERLAARGLVVRTFGHEPLLASYLRITVAHRDANDRLVAALAELAGGPGAIARGGTSKWTAPSPDGPAAGRSAEVHRSTRETRIDLRLSLDGSGRARVTTGLGFLDHMLTALAFWSMLDLDLRCAGDLWVDEHHTIEDCAIALGEALDAALGDRAGLRRFGDARAPLDEALAHATVDLSGRGVAGIDLGLGGDRIGAVPASLFPHFLDTLARRSRIGLHVSAEGSDDHHRVEAAFKALALALRTAVAEDPARHGIASTKGVL